MFFKLIRSCVTALSLCRQRYGEFLRWIRTVPRPQRGSRYLDVGVADQRPYFLQNPTRFLRKFRRLRDGLGNFTHALDILGSPGLDVLYSLAHLGGGAHGFFSQLEHCVGYGREAASGFPDAGGLRLL